jgi:mannose PTS system EIID component
VSELEVSERSSGNLRLKRGDLTQATSRSVQIQALLTPERMQGPGFCFALLPALRRLYAGSEELATALTRHMSYFATHPVLAGYVIGAAARLEERRARGEPIAPEQIEQLKQSLASPLAALGDPLFWSTLRPLAGLLGVLAIGLVHPPAPAEPDQRVLLCPLFTLLAYNAVALPFRIVAVSRGYAEADQPAALLRSLKLSEWVRVLGRAGALGYGALVALVLISLDFRSAGWGEDIRARLFSLAPLLLGGIIGFVGLRRWPGRVVEVALAVLLAAAGLALAV